MSTVDVAQTSQPLTPGWLQLQDALEKAFAGQADLQSRAREMVAWLGRVLINPLVGNAGSSGDLPTPSRQDEEATASQDQAA